MDSFISTIDHLLSAQLHLSIRMMKLFSDCLMLVKIARCSEPFHGMYGKQLLRSRQ